MEDLKRAVSETQSDVKSVAASVTKAHQRIDEMVTCQARMSSDVHEIKGQIGPLSNNVQSITDAVVRKGISVGSGNSDVVMLKILDVVKWIIVAAVAGSIIGMAGYYGLRATGKSGDTQIEIDATQ